MTDRCVCCDLPIASCGKQVEDRETALEREVPAAMLATPRWFAAKFGGLCMRCGDYDFAAGEPITRLDNGSWAAGCCFDAIQRERVSHG